MHHTWASTYSFKIIVDIPHALCGCTFLSNGYWHSLIQKVHHQSILSHLVDLWLTIFVVPSSLNCVCVVVHDVLTILRLWMTWSRLQRINLFNKVFENVVVFQVKLVVAFIFKSAYAYVTSFSLLPIKVILSEYCNIYFMLASRWSWNYAH